MNELDDSQVIDVPIERLRPLRERTVSKREYNRILASIRAIGLIEPLIVYPDGENYEILDGNVRHRALLELGVEIVPCILGKQREALTPNRMVNRISPLQEQRMIKKSLEELDEKTIAGALGIAGIDHRLRKTLLDQLHPDVALAFDQGKLSRECTREMTFVKPVRQREILAAMQGYKDYSIVFARSLILKTPPDFREPRRRRTTPWNKKDQRKHDLLKKLAEAEERHDFYSRLYRQYTIDLLRIAIYARSLINNVRIRTYMDQHFPDIVARFESVIADARETA